MDYRFHIFASVRLSELQFEFRSRTIQVTCKFHSKYSVTRVCIHVATLVILLILKNIVYKAFLHVHTNYLKVTNTNDTEIKLKCDFTCKYAVIVSIRVQHHLIIVR